MYELSYQPFRYAGAAADYAPYSESRDVIVSYVLFSPSDTAEGLTQ
jgi:hypothetical protein